MRDIDIKALKLDNNHAKRFKIPPSVDFYDQVSDLINNYNELLEAKKPKSPRHDVLRIISEKAPYNKEVWNAIYDFFCREERKNAGGSPVRFEESMKVVHKGEQG